MTVKQTGQRFGLVIAAILVVYGIIFNVLNLRSVPLALWAFYLLPPLGAVLAHRSFRKSNGHLTFREGLAIAAIVVVVASAVYSFWVFVYNGWIDDSLLVEVKTSAQAELESRDLDAESRSRAVRQIELFTRPALFSVFVWVRLVVFGMLTSVVAALIMRRAPSTTSS